jgi:hypothetical protein
VVPQVVRGLRGVPRNPIWRVRITWSRSITQLRVSPLAVRMTRNEVNVRRAEFHGSEAEFERQSVFPIPPMLVSVTRRLPSRNTERSSSCSFSRPTNIVRGAARELISSSASEWPSRELGNTTSALSIAAIIVHKDTASGIEVRNPCAYKNVGNRQEQRGKWANRGNDFPGPRCRVP